MKKFLIALAIAAGIFAILWKINADSNWGTSITITQTATCGTGCYTFTAAPIPDNGTDGYSYFWFFGDGAYAITNVNTVSHTFQRFHGSNASGNTTRNVHVEVTKLYKKGDKPTSALIPGGFTIDPAEDVAEPLTAGQPLSIVPNRTPVPGDYITYVVTYGKLCGDGVTPHKITITYNISKLTSEFTLDRGFHNENITNPENGTITILPTSASFGSNLARRIFLTFKVKEGVPEGEQVGISGNIFFDETQSCLGEPVSASATAAPSHDPNYIEANHRAICGEVTNGQKMTYKIHFQNTGAGEAKDVVVRTYLPLFFSDDPAKIVTKGPNQIGAFTYLGNRELQWNLSGNNSSLKNGHTLKGTGQKGFGTLFSENETRDTIEFEVEFDDTDISADFFDSCVSIVKRAEIIFDCNPSIFTNFHETEIICDSLSISFPDSCGCVAVLQEIQSAIALSGSPQSLNLPSQAQRADVVWYPPVFISDPFSFNSNVSPPRSMDYVAIVRRDNCSRVWFQYPFTMDCDLFIESNLRMSDCDKSPNVKGKIKAEACTQANAADLVWNWECIDQSGTIQINRTGKTLTLEDCPPGVYHLTVKNTANGCWAEKTVVIANACPNPVFSTRTVLIGVGVLVGLFLLFRIFRAKKK